jgi:hypothetical protein
MTQSIITINTIDEYTTLYNEIKSNKEFATTIELLTFTDNVQIDEYKILEMKTMLPNLKQLNYNNQEDEEDDEDGDEHTECLCHRHDRYE